ncbi:MAG: hypothetical protein ACREML_08530 [Vulcanimicrobiaceae bacterium]
MARRPPAFIRNLCDARHLNIAHGLYPRERLPDTTLTAFTAWLNTHVTIAGGRTYAGGLTKFEPRDLERVLVPRPENLPYIAETNDHTECIKHATGLGRRCACNPSADRS